ncbi:hypothetical protein Tco_0533389 [Tanacetum coccineum]
MSSSSSSSYRRYNQDFRGCPIRDKSKKCGVYGFLDLELPSDYYKGLVYSHTREQSIEEDEQDACWCDGWHKWGGFQQLIRICCNVGSSKSLVPPFGSPERPRPDVTPRIAESFKSRPCHPELIRMYGYQSTDEYYADYDYWNTWVQDESTDEEDEDEVMTTKDDDLLFYQDTFPVDKFVPFGKAMGSKRIEKSPTIPVAVLGLCNTLTWVEIEKKLRKKPPMKH